MRILNRISNRVPNRIDNRELYGLHGVDSLSRTILINGSPITPTLTYKGGDADGTNWDQWTYGVVLPLEAGTVPTYNNGAPVGINWDVNTDSVLFNEGGYYKSGDTSTGNISTNDVIIEYIAYWPAVGANLTCLSKRSGSNAGYTLYHRSDETAWFLIEDTGTDNAIIQSAAISNGVYHHIFLYVNKDEASTNGSQLYVDGVASGSGVDFSAVGDADAVIALTIGAATNGTAPMSDAVVLFNLWQGAGIIQAGATGKTEIASIALARSNAFWGV